MGTHQASIGFGGEAKVNVAGHVYYPLEALTNEHKVTILRPVSDISLQQDSAWRSRRRSIIVETGMPATMLPYLHNHREH
jgi:hypothetical protein